MVITVFDLSHQILNLFLYSLTNKVRPLGIGKVSTQIE